MADVAVIVPTFERAATIEASVASLLAERDVAIEVVVVDDGSTDDTLARLGRLTDPRLRVLPRPHAGIAASRNAGIAASTAPYVAFHDSDDIALPGRLSRPVAYLERHRGCDFVVQNGRMLPDGEPWIAPDVAAGLRGRPIGVADVFRWNLGQLQGMCFTRRCLEATGPFDTSLRILDDLDLVLRVTLGFRAVFLDVPAFAYRRHTGGVARDRATVREEAILVADKLAREHPEALDLVGRDTFARRQARRYVRLARARERAGDAGGARTALVQARQLDPGRLGSVTHRLRALLLALRTRR
jgi:glycosyltransferase involved in cell wall biosynthesis